MAKAESKKLKELEDLIEKQYQDKTPQEFREFCESQKILSFPSKVRSKVWHFLLEVNNDLPQIPADLKLNNETKESVYEEFTQNKHPEVSLSSWGKYEKVLALYEMKNKVDISEKGLPILLEPFFLIEEKEDIVYNYFSAFLDKYFSQQFLDYLSVVEYESCLFRLLIFYHDPQLGLAFDKIALDYNSFIKSWFSSLFSVVSQFDCVLKIWDYIMIKDHPSVRYFFALSILQFWREDLLRRDNPATFLKELRISPTQASQLCDLADNLSQTTPNSLKEQTVFIANQTEEFHSWLKTSLKNIPCLSVSVQEYLILETQETTKGISSYVVDCRPKNQTGGLLKSFRLDPTLVAENPAEFSKVMEKFKSMAGTHFYFFGSGMPEEEGQVTLNVLEFIKKGIKHISVTRGGYKALHNMFIEDDMTLFLLDHTPENCDICNPNHPKIEDIPLLNSKPPNKSGFFGKKLSEIFRETSTAIKEKSSQFTKSASSILEKINSNMTSPTNTSSNAQSSQTSSSKNEQINHEFEPNYTSLNSWKKEGNSIFPNACKVNESSKDNGCIIITQRSFMWLREHNRNNFSIEIEHPISDIMRITFKKSNQNFLTFHYEHHKERFIVNQSQQIIQLVAERSK